MPQNNPREIRCTRRIEETAELVVDGRRSVQPGMPHEWSEQPAHSAEIQQCFRAIIGGFAPENCSNGVLITAHDVVDPEGRSCEEHQLERRRERTSQWLDSLPD